MPSKSKAQFRFMKMMENDPDKAKEAGIEPSVAKEFTKGNKGKKRFAKLRDKLGMKNE